MAVAGDIFRLTDFQVYGGQEALNVYYYRLEDAPAAGNPLAGLAAAFIGIVLPKILDIQSASVDHTFVRVENLGGVEIYEETVGESGNPSLGTASNLPSFVALTFQLVRSNRNTRHGSKRFVGVTDSQVNGNAYTGSSGDITALQDALKLTLNPGAVDNFAPVIIRHPVMTPPYNPVYSYVQDCLFKGVRTQNTRKVGHGS